MGHLAKCFRSLTSPDPLADYSADGYLEDERKEGMVGWRGTLIVGEARLERQERGLVGSRAGFAGGK